MADITANWDRSVDAAYISFREIGVNESVTRRHVDDEEGNVAAVLDFARDGELLGVEVLDAEKRIPRVFRPGYDGPR